MLETLYSTGMRVSELVALNLPDVDLERRVARCTGKGGRQRSVPLRTSAINALARLPDHGRPRIAPNEEQALFVNHRGSRLTRQGFWLILKAYARQAGIQDITPHTLAPLIRDPRAAARLRAARCAADARPCQHLDHAGLSPHRHAQLPPLSRRPRANKPIRRAFLHR